MKTCGKECASSPPRDYPSPVASRGSVLTSERKRTLSNISKQFYYPGLIAVLGLQRAAILCQLIFLVETQTKFTINNDGKKWARIASWKISLFFPGVPERNIRLFIHDLEATGAISTKRAMNGFRPDKARWISINEGWLTNHGNITYNPFDEIKARDKDAAIAAPSSKDQAITAAKRSGNNCRKIQKMRQLLPSNKGRVTKGDIRTDTSYLSRPRAARQRPGVPEDPHRKVRMRSRNGSSKAGGVMKASEISTDAVDQERLKKTAKKMEARVTLPVFISTWQQMASLVSDEKPLSFTKKEGALAKQLVKWLATNDVKALSFLRFTIENWDRIRAATRWPDSRKFRIAAKPRFEEAYWIREDIVRLMAKDGVGDGNGSTQAHSAGAEVFTKASEVPANHPHRKWILDQISRKGKAVLR